jgi:hypothetical protein
MVRVLATTLLLLSVSGCAYRAYTCNKCGHTYHITRGLPGQFGNNPCERCEGGRMRFSHYSTEEELRWGREHQ